MLACAESCTGGLVTAALTDIPGSSRVLWGGVAAYSNACKVRLLGVDARLLEERGAVSREVAGAMAELLLAVSGADIALAVTGIAGPDGGTREKPVGTVWFAWRTTAGSGAEAHELFAGDRDAVRLASALRAIEGAVTEAARFVRGVDKA